MREIVFRGKRLDNGQWIYGDLRQFSEHSWGIHDRESRRTLRVDPNTVGQDTGAIDQVFQSLFEGDVVEATKMIGYPFDDLEGPEEPFREIGTVIYDSNKCAFGIKNAIGDFHYLCTFLGDGDVTVLGNIHDNPELVSGSDKLEDKT